MPSAIGWNLPNRRVWRRVDHFCKRYSTDHGQWNPANHLRHYIMQSSPFTQGGLERRGSEGCSALDCGVRLRCLSWYLTLVKTVLIRLGSENLSSTHTTPHIHTLISSESERLREPIERREIAPDCPYVRRQPTSGVGYMIGGGVGFLVIVNLNRGSCSGKSFSWPQFRQVAWYEPRAGRASISQ
jgi:hypothetical protein